MTCENLISNRTASIRARLVDHLIIVFSTTASLNEFESSDSGIKEQLRLFRGSRHPAVVHRGGTSDISVIPVGSEPTRVSPMRFTP
jgi:hypothetical protein